MPPSIFIPQFLPVASQPDMLPWPLHAIFSYTGGVEGLAMSLYRAYCNTPPHQDLRWVLSNVSRLTLDCKKCSPPLPPTSLDGNAAPRRPPPVTPPEIPCWMPPPFGKSGCSQGLNPKRGYGLPLMSSKRCRRAAACAHETACHEEGRTVHLQG